MLLLGGTRAAAQVVDLAPVKVTATVKRYAFDSSRARITRPPGHLYGTVLKPRGVSRPPVVLFVSGGGPMDRDGNVAGSTRRTDALRQLAESLAVQGIASLRFDKRGVGASKDALIPEAEVRFPYFAFDVVEWMAWLDRRQQFGPIVVAGQDEGATLAFMTVRTLSAAAYIGLTPVARRPEDMLREQLTVGQSPEHIAFVEAVIDSLRDNTLVDRIPIGLADVLRPTIQPFLMSWMRHPTTAELWRVPTPCLLIHAGLDLEIDPAEADSLAKAQPDCLRATIWDMSHTLKRVRAEEIDQQRSAYTDPREPLGALLVPTIVNFVQLVTDKAPDKCLPDSADAGARLLIGRPIARPSPESPVLFDGEYIGRFAAATLPAIRLDSVAKAVLVTSTKARRYGPAAAKCGALVMQSPEYAIADSVEALTAIWAALRNPEGRPPTAAPSRVVALSLADSATPAALRTPLMRRELQRRGVLLVERLAVGPDTLLMTVSPDTTSVEMESEAFRLMTRLRGYDTQRVNNAPCRRRIDARVPFVSRRYGGTFLAEPIDELPPPPVSCPP